MAFMSRWLTLPPISLVVEAAAWKYRDLLLTWPTVIRDLNTDLLEMGATHKCISGDPTMALEYTDQRLELIPRFRNCTYGETLSLENFEDNKRYGRFWIEWLKKTGQAPRIIYASDDVKDDKRGPTGPLMRAQLKLYLPNTKILVSPTAGTSHSYYDTMQEPFPDIVMVQLYDHHRKRSIDADKILKRVRPQDAIWFACFGGDNTWYLPVKGATARMMKRVWDSGFRGLYGLFAAVYERGIGLYNLDKVRYYKNWKKGRTYLWNEVKVFRTCVASLEGRR